MDSLFFLNCWWLLPRTNGAKPKGNYYLFVYFFARFAKTEDGITSDSSTDEDLKECPWRNTRYVSQAQRSTV